jgi:hypothetical protein
MLKQKVRQAAETIGLVPTLAEAEAAEQRRQTLTKAQAAVEAARVNLDSLHDAGAPAADISKAEAALADAQITADRAQLSAAAAERRLAAALEDEQSKTKQAARSALSKSTATYDKAAAEIDRLAVLIAAQVEIINKQYEAFNVARTAGVAGLYMPVTGATLATLAIERAIAAQAGQYTDNKPSASEAGARVTGAVGAA